MLDVLISGIFENLPDEMKGNLRKIDEFMPVIDMYHESIPLQKDKGELGISYLIRFENGGIVLYQVALASKAEINGGKPFVSRQLAKWDVSAKIKELTGS